MEEANKKMKKVVRLKGGLGNQLYIMAKVLELDLNSSNTVLKLDCFSGYVLDRFHRKPILFKLFPNFISYKSSSFDIVFGYILRICRRFSLKSRYYYEDELEAKYFELKHSSFIYVEGYFQDKGPSDLIKRYMLASYSPPRIPVQFVKIYQELCSGRAALVHVRLLNLTFPSTLNSFLASGFLNFLGALPAYYISDSKSEIRWLDELGLRRLYIDVENRDVIEFEFLRCAVVKCLARSTFSDWATLLSPSTDIVYRY